MRGGRRLEAPTLDETRGRAAAELARLPEPLRRLESGFAYPVEIAPALRRLAEDVDRRLVARLDAAGG